MDEEFDYERYKTNPEYQQRIDAGTFDQQFQALMGNILTENIERSGISRYDIELKKHSTTIDTLNRELYAGCPFCEFDSEFHWKLGTHMRTEHPKKTIQRFSKMIDFFFSKPEKLFENREYLTKPCPFCIFTVE